MAREQRWGFRVHESPDVSPALFRAAVDRLITSIALDHDVPCEHERSARGFGTAARESAMVIATAVSDETELHERLLRERGVVLARVRELKLSSAGEREAARTSIPNRARAHVGTRTTGSAEGPP
jgi:hypothetical protein